MKYIIAILLCLFATPVFGASQNIVVIFDESGSMAESLNDGRVKIDAAKGALIQFVNKLPDNDINLGVLTLTHGWLVNFEKINKPVVTAQINRVLPDGGTPLGNAMKQAADALLAMRARDHYGVYRLLIVTDGEATDSDVVIRYTPDILARGIVLDLIGVRMDSRHQLASVAHSYKNVMDTAALNQALSDVLAETVVSNKGQSDDFALLEGMPDGVAKSVIQKYSDDVSQNQPIGEAPRPVVSIPALQATVAPATSSTAPLVAVVNSNPATAVDTGMSIGVLLLVIAGVIVGIVIILMICGSILDN